MRDVATLAGADGTGITVAVTITVTGGEADLPVVSGLTLAGGISTGASLSFTATASDASAALAALDFVGDPDATTGSVVIDVSDQGNTGTPGALTDQMTMTVTMALTCGDGIKHSSEACDDDNTADGDGCSSTCTIEADTNCAVVSCGSTCTRVVMTPTTSRAESVVDAGMVVTLTLSGSDVWHANVGSAGAATDAVLDGFSGLLATAPRGMQIGVVDLWTATHVTRISDTVVTISIPSSFLYAIDADDALQLSSIGSSALASGVALSGLDETMPVTDEAPVATLVSSQASCDSSGILFDQVPSGATIDLVLAQSTWDPTAWTDEATVLGYFDSLGLTSSAEMAVLDAHATTAERPDYLTIGDVTVSESMIRFTFPQSPPAFLTLRASALTPSLPAVTTRYGSAVSFSFFCELAWP